MSRMAQDHGAINLSQGFPDFAVPEALVALLYDYSKKGYNQYPPMAGVPYLLQQIARKTRSVYGCQTDPETEITVTSGATEALFVAIQAMVHPGDEVIVLDPAYDSYDPAIRLAGGKAVHVPLSLPDFHVDWDRVANAITPSTRMIAVNSPHNPCGQVFDGADLNALAKLVEKHGLYVLSDEVYEHMVFDGKDHESMLCNEVLRQHSFVISSFGKTFHATGWKIAYCIAPQALTREFRKVHQFVTFTTHTPSQWALATFLEKHPEHYQTLPSFYQQ
ncbi:MAG: methionine aminotransferase, partial [Gammaproteobacteria bacterium]|nr:methionine aminotransferase [Gammaproteobacteria bacterium]